MSGQMTNKTMVVVTRLGDFWVTPERGKAVMAIKNDSPGDSIELDGNLVSCIAIDGVLTADKYAELNIKRRGGWQCKFGYWHERNNQCAHAQLGAA